MKRIYVYDIQTVTACSSYAVIHSLDERILCGKGDMNEV